jgi:hypothetical protein
MAEWSASFKTLLNAHHQRLRLLRIGGLLPKCFESACQLVGGQSYQGQRKQHVELADIVTSDLMDQRIDFPGGLPS